MDNNKSFWIKDIVWLTVFLWGAFPCIMLAIEVKERTNSWIKAIISGIVALFLIIGIYGSTGNSNKDTRISYLEDKLEEARNENKSLIKNTPDIDNNENETTEETKKSTPITTKKIELKEYVFGSGNYTCGEDFEPGKYNVVAIEGNSGNVITSNLFDGGINEVMGLDTSWAIQEINNIEFKDKMTLEIRGIKIKLIPSN